jgi:hypothetical protein
MAIKGESKPDFEQKALGIAALSRRGGRTTTPTEIHDGGVHRRSRY